MLNVSVRYDAVFYKKSNMAYISHLDLMLLFRRAIRRARLPFVVTGGFSPRVRISIAKALKLGVASEKEEMSLWLTKNIPEKDIQESFNKQMPEGVGITNVVRRA